MLALKRTLLALLFALLLFPVLSHVFPVLSHAQSLSYAKPEDVGFSRERLDRIAGMLNADIAKGTIPGAALLIVRNGKIAFYESFGWLDAATKTPMPKGAIFRTYSMSKPITSVAAMILVEQGKLFLNDPVQKYIPAFAHEGRRGKVGRAKCRSGAGGAAHYCAGFDAPYFGPDLWILARNTRHKDVSGRQPLRHRRDQCRFCPSHRQAAARGAARLQLEL